VQNNGDFLATLKNMLIWTRRTYSFRSKRVGT